MQARSLSLRAILLLTIGSLTLLISLMATREVYIEWQQWTLLQSLRSATITSGRFFNTLENLSREREVTVALLRSPASNSNADLARHLLEIRQRTDEGLRAITDDLHRSYAMLGLGSEALDAQVIRFNQLRGEADRQIALLPDQRDPAVFSRWFDGSTVTIGTVYNQWMGFTQHFTQIDPIVTQRMMFQHFLGLLIRYAGRERAMISGLIVANQPISSAEQAQLLEWHGVMEQGWEMCARLSERSQLTPTISPVLADAHSHYLTLYDMVHDLFYIPGAVPLKSYPITVDLWLEVAGGSTDSLNILKDAVLKQTQDYAEQLEQKAKQAILLHLLVLLVALGLCSYSFWIINWRVIGPTRQMIKALLDTAAGRPVSYPSATRNRKDEIGQLAQVLQQFQKNSMEIKESQERYRALVESSSQIVWVWKDGGIEEKSPLYQWWEATTGQPGGMIATLGWLDVVHPDDREKVRKIWENTLATGTSLDIEYRLRARDGSYRYVATRGIPLLAADGSIREFIGSLSDVTDRKEAEAGRLRYMRELERSNKELDDFAYIASHDLKEPLRGIHNHSRFLLEDNEGKLEQESTDRLHRLLYLSQRMEKLVNDLLYFSRLGRQQLAIQPTDLNEVVHDIETMIDVFMHERNARIIIPTKLPTITCDTPRITEALRNLITNAIKYNDKPKKIVEVGFLPQHTGPDGKMMSDVLYVKDNGIGIALEFYQEVFRIFKRLQNSKDGEEGTGVGLTFVKKIIERHGGKIWIESEIGKGSVFLFTLGRLSDDTDHA